MTYAYLLRGRRESLGARLGFVFVCVSMCCICVHIHVQCNLELWMSGESWLAMKDFNPPFPDLKAGYPVLLCFFVCFHVHFVQLLQAFEPF